MYYDGNSKWKTIVKISKCKMTAEISNEIQPEKFIIGRQPEKFQFGRQPQKLKTEDDLKNIKMEDSI